MESNTNPSPQKTFSFADRVKKYREQKNLTQRGLARLLNVTSASVSRWETGTAKPPYEVAQNLEILGFGKVSEQETNRDSLSRIDQIPISQLMDGVVKSIRFGSTDFDIKPAPYVFNGPENQLEFFQKLVDLQGNKPKVDSISLKRLSIIEEVGSIKTSQFELERPKNNAKTWNSNYGTHGWHRYVGRFPPHLVRALINHFSLEIGDTVLDPFVGSGTTIVESRMLGLNSIGIDICPLSSLISRAKSKFPSDVSGLRKTLTKYQNFFDKRIKESVFNKNDLTHADLIRMFNNVIPAFSNYEKWFTLEALLGSLITVQFIRQLDGYEQDFFACQLSSLMRSIGNVEVNVVRAEYSEKLRENVNVKKLFTKRCLKSIEDIKQTLLTHQNFINDKASVTVFESGIQHAEIASNSIDAIITSPPYGVESISYLRTHLLSYRSLSTILNANPYENNKDIIGSEYLDKNKEGEDKAIAYSKTYKEFFEAYDFENMPKKLILRVRMMKQFFDDMVLTALLFEKWLKVGGHIAFVVGNKRLGNHVIPTDKIILEIFSHFGIILEESIKHKLKTNNSNSQVPWQERVIKDEFVMIFKKV
ncbi:MAG: DNA (cytosine-5-)-methyltransferase [Parvularculales bacterium]